MAETLEAGGLEERLAEALAHLIARANAPADSRLGGRVLEIDAPPPPPVGPWRLELAQLPDGKRAWWGARANALEAGGVPFPESERLAFEELRADPTTGRPAPQNRTLEKPGRRRRKLDGPTFDSMS